VLVDGHDVERIKLALMGQKAQKNGKPKALIARTIKGHGVPGLENAPLSHIINPKPELLDKLLGE
jgi:transketolase